MSKLAEPAFDFKLDKFQEEAIEHIRAGKNVIVCAPTGAGKTIIAEQAIKDALGAKKKVFYTTPLKALSNQKFLEFSKKYGEANVGIITGDTSKNREASIVIMTTEVYRNMLYGTSFGSVDPYLQELQYVILDECHYINEESRGTVWEESIIYSPKSVQIIGLSATVNNPKELVSWIEDIQSECALVETDFRPVPLHHLHFKDDQLVPLLTPNQKLNPKLKEHSDNRFGKRSKGDRGHSKSSKAVSPESVVQELHNKNMLPAIYFVFSRKGCDNAAEKCDKLNLLSKEESQKAGQIIDAAIKGYKHLESHPQLDLLRRGIATHHAGLLPQWKTLVEELFNQALVKVVFATETLAAGINMPARATVIQNISKRSDDGHRKLRASEFMQMSGRAGRRGMDDKGFVITLQSNYETAGEMARLATAKPEDLASHFTAGYEMVLNLMQKHTLDETKELVQKSFGQAQANKSLEPIKGEMKTLEYKIVDLQAPLCPAEIGDLATYRQMQDKLDDMRTKKKDLERKMGPGVSDLEEAIHIMTLEAQNFPCNGCPKQKPCSQQMSKIRRYKKRVREIKDDVNSKKSVYWGQFQNILNLLKDTGYVSDNFAPTTLGETCAAIRSENSLLITELTKGNIFDQLNPVEFAAAISAIAAGNNSRSAREKVFLHPSDKVYDVVEEMRSDARKVLQSQRRFKIEKPVDIDGSMAPLVEEWAKGKTWDELIELTSSDDGDVIRVIRRTVDLIKQLSHAPNINPIISKLAKEAIPLLEREPVLDAI